MLWNMLGFETLGAGETLGVMFLVGMLMLIGIKWAVEAADRDDRRRVERKFEQKLDKAEQGR